MTKEDIVPGQVIRRAGARFRWRGLKNGDFCKVKGPNNTHSGYFWINTPEYCDDAGQTSIEYWEVPIEFWELGE